jgi:hypothetical protein
VPSLGIRPEGDVDLFLTLFDGDTLIRISSRAHTPSCMAATAALASRVVPTLALRSAARRVSSSARGFAMPTRAHQVPVGSHLSEANVDPEVAAGAQLVHFSAQLEPCLSQENTLHTLNTPSTPATQPLRAPPIPCKALKLS